MPTAPLNAGGIWKWDADIVEPTVISLAYTLSLTGDVTDTGATIQQITQTFSISDTVNFTRKTPFDTLADDEWMVETGGTNVEMGDSAPNQSFFRNTVAEPDIEVVTEKPFTGSYTVDPHTTHPDPDDPEIEIPDPPVEYPFSGTLTITLSFSKTDLTTGKWFVNFSLAFDTGATAFNAEYYDSDSDPAATMTLTVAPRTLKLSGGSTDFGKHWNSVTPDGFGYPGYTVNSWDVEIDAVISCT